MARFKAIDHEAQLSLIDHLDELRSRLIVMIAVLTVAFALCFWQNHLLLQIADVPLGDRKLLTLGVTEPFMTTMTVAGYGALTLSLPIILYQIFAFVIPAFSPGERKLAMPVLIAVPLLFIAGLVFSYFFVMPLAIDVLTNFNSGEFDIQVRASDYYSFFATTLLAFALLFQIPVFILGLTKLGIITPEQLSKNRRYAILVIAIIAMALPGLDPMTMLVEMVPLLFLYELSIVLARMFGGPKPVEHAEPATQDH